VTVQNVNNKRAFDTLGAALDASQTSFTATTNYATAGFPAAPFAILCESELMLVTSIGTGTNWTVERGYGGTTGASHSSGKPFHYKVTAEWFTEIADRLGSFDKFRGKGYTTATLDGGYDDKVQVYWTGSDWSTRNGWLTNGIADPDLRVSFGASVGGWIRIDADAAVSGEILRYWFVADTNGIGPATFEGIEVEFSDNDSSWTSHYSITGLSSVHNELKAVCAFDIDVSSAGAHRYWRVTIENAVTGNWMFPAAIQLF